MPKKVIAYTLPTCPHCIKAKEFLKENNIEFENKDVGADHEAAREMIQKTSQKGVPVLDIEGKIIVGFDKEAIAKELGIK